MLWRNFKAGMNFKMRRLLNKEVMDILVDDRFLAKCKFMDG